MTIGNVNMISDQLIRKAAVFDPQSIVLKNGQLFSCILYLFYYFGIFYVFLQMFSLGLLNTLIKLKLVLIFGQMLKIAVVLGMRKFIILF